MKSNHSRKRLASLATLRLALCASRRISCLIMFRTAKVLRSVRAGESERARSEAPVSDPASQRLSRESLSITLRAVLVRSSEPNISPARFETRDDIYFEGVPALATLIKSRLFSTHVARPSSPSGRTAGLGRHHVLSVRALSSLSRESLFITLRAVLVRSSEPNISPVRVSGDHFYSFEGVPALATLIKSRLFSTHVARRALKLQRRSRARITRP